MKQLRRVIYITLCLLVLLALCACSATDYFNAPSASPAHQADALSVQYLDVGQGDGALVLLPDGKTMLIDGGIPNAFEDAVQPALRRNGITRIDYLVASHPHLDHIGGVAEVLEQYEVGEVWMPPLFADLWSYDKMKQAIEDQDIPVRIPAQQPITLQGDGYTITAQAFDTQDLNSSSIILHIAYGDTTFLFAGDLPHELENQLTDDLACTVLKVSHHGSLDSSHAEFLDIVQPDYAVLSLGENNDYGYPKQRTLERLESAGAEIYRTDEDGDITARSDGKSVRMSTEH